MKENDGHKRPGLEMRLLKYGSYVTLAWFGAASVYWAASPAEIQDEHLEYKPEVIASAQQQGYQVSQGPSDTAYERGDDGYLRALAVISGIGATSIYIVRKAHKDDKKSQAAALEIEPVTRPIITHEQAPLDATTELRFAAIAEHIVWNEDGSIRSET